MSGRTTLFHLATLLLLAVGCSSKTENSPVAPVVTQDSTGSIHGTIVDARTGAPLRSVSIVTMPPSQAVTSDSLGGYRIDGVGAGVYSVQASRFGYLTKKVDISVARGKSTLADIQLDPGLQVIDRPEVRSPQPENASLIEVADPLLEWICGDPVADSLRFDLLFGESVSRLDTIARDLTGRSFRLPVLGTGRTYYWKVIVEETSGRRTAGPLWKFSVASQMGYALEFGGDDWISVNDRDDLDLSGGSFTIEGWIRPRKASYFQWMFDKSNNNENADYLLGSTGNLFVFQTRGMSNLLYSTTHFELGQSYHIAAVLDIEDVRVKLYVNGKLEASKTLQGSSVSNNSVLRIGRRDIFNEYLVGTLDELRIWNRARSQQEIFAAMNLRLTGNEDGLVAYWPFDEGTGLVATDATGNGHGGSLDSPDWIESPFFP